MKSDGDLFKNIHIRIRNMLLIKTVCIFSPRKWIIIIMQAQALKNDHKCDTLLVDAINILHAGIHIL